MKEFPFQGPRYTWTNKQLGSSLLLELLDRAYVSNSWSILFPDHILYHEPILCSDHAAIIYATSNATTINKRPYQLESRCFKIRKLFLLSERFE